jgi:uncharacterized damage-inducible protein DinB
MGVALRTSAAVHPEASSAAAGALRDLLDDLMRLLMTMPARAYTARVAVSSGTIGGHVRHTLDHVATLVATSLQTEFSYDRRSRGTPVETDPSVAVREILRLAAALDRWSREPSSEMMAVTAMVAPGQSVTGWSSRARELAFVVSHTIHHHAIIALLLEMQGIGIESNDFGYSPSTPRT